jgi:hypothetical protein
MYLHMYLYNKCMCYIVILEESDKSQSTITYSSNTSNVVCTDNSESPSQWYRNFGSSDHNQQEESTYTYNFVHAHVLVSNFF